MTEPKRLRAAPSPDTEPALSVDDLVVTELSRFGSRTAAELLASVQAPTYSVIDSVQRLFVAGVIGFSADRLRFTLRVKR